HTVDLPRALGEAGEKEYRRLLRVLRMARGHFTLLPVESDFSPGLRNALLERLRADLTAHDLCLRVVPLSHTRWDLMSLPEMEAPVRPSEVVAIIGLEDTPDIVQEPGRKPERPPALALLNQ